MLRQLSRKDIPVLLKELQHLSDDVKHQFHPHPFTNEALQAARTAQGDYHYVFVNDDYILGYSFLRTFNKYPIPTYGGVIWKQYRGKGFGSIMLDETLDKARELGFSTVKLKVYKTNNRAFQLYKKHGFTIIDEEGSEWWMQKTL